jgi:hypothetical protein
MLAWNHKCLGISKEVFENGEMLRFFLIDFFDIFSKLKYRRIRKCHQNRGVGGDYKLATVIFRQIFDQGEIAN